MCQGMLECLVQHESSDAVGNTSQSVKCLVADGISARIIHRLTVQKAAKFGMLLPLSGLVQHASGKKPRGDKAHMLDPDCKWNLARVMPEG